MHLRRWKYLVILRLARVAHHTILPGVQFSERMLALPGGVRPERAA
jgi:hypothetical protein